MVGKNGVAYIQYVDYVTPVYPSLFFLDGLDLEVESDEAEHKTLEVLYQVVEASETKITFISSEQRLSWDTTV